MFNKIASLPKNAIIILYFSSYTVAKKLIQSIKISLNGGVDMINCGLCDYFKTIEFSGKTFCYCELMGFLFDNQIEEYEFDITPCHEYHGNPRVDMRHYKDCV